jgi:hypothetical protein
LAEKPSVLIFSRRQNILVISGKPAIMFFRSAKCANKIICPRDNRGERLLRDEKDGFTRYVLRDGGSYAIRVRWNGGRATGGIDYRSVGQRIGRTENPL